MVAGLGAPRGTWSPAPGLDLRRGRRRQQQGDGDEPWERVELALRPSEKEAHHVKFRSRGGSDDPANVVALCAACHLRGIHDGHLRVTGRAGERLVWQMGVRRDGGAREVWEQTWDEGRTAYRRLA